jgi:hypothetical protein
MSRQVSRRQVLGAGATIGLSSVAGCPTDDTTTDAQSKNPTSKQDSEEQTTQQEDPTNPSGILPAQYIVTKDNDEILAYNGDTLRIEFRGAAGEGDGRVLQQTFDAVEGGRVFIRRAEYTPDRRLTVSTNYTQVHSDFARLTFQDHPPQEDHSQIDFLIGCTDETTKHVEVNGLVLDGNKSNRTTRTRTADICEAVEVTLRNCIIFGGKSVDGGGGYGIGEDDDTDFITIDNCVVRDSDRHAYHPSANHHYILNSTFVNNAQKTGTVFDLKGTNAVVANNLFENNGHGVILDDAGDSSSDGRIVITGNVFVDNYLEDIASGQIEFTDASTDSVMINDNTFVLPAIEAQETSAHVLVDTDGQIGTVHLRNNHFEGGGHRAFESFTETGRHINTLVVEHNTFSDIPSEIGLIASAERLLLRDNLFECTGPGSGRLSVKECSSGVVSGNVTYNGAVDVAGDLGLVVERNHDF